MKIIEKGIKTSGKCKCCGNYKMKSQFYKWYSPFDNRLIYDMICIKCAKREFGSKRAKAFKEL
tara:strand:+ start:92 stop:280 length:189 start_codon:yes stop_codon:yes gene_type:complete